MTLTEDEPAYYVPSVQYGDRLYCPDDGSQVLGTLSSFLVCPMCGRRWE